jgi:hypothetical protein
MRRMAHKYYTYPMREDVKKTILPAPLGRDVVTCDGVPAIVAG